MKPEYRAQAWKILLGYLPTNASRRHSTLQKKRAEYLDAVAQHYGIDDNSRTMQQQEVLRQVLVDVPRTAPSVKLFRDERIKTLLTRILYIWAMRHPASSYVQGINDLVMPLIVTYLTQEDILDGETNSVSAKEASPVKGDAKDIDYDAVLEGRIMETISDDQLQKVILMVSHCYLQKCKCSKPHSFYYHAGRGGLLLLPDQSTRRHTRSLHIRSTRCATDGSPPRRAGQSN
jgi:Rab-GTPase-TBC domain